jgi:hypothetical protein
MFGLLSAVNVGDCIPKGGYISAVVEPLGVLPEQLWIFIGLPEPFCGAPEFACS